MNKEQYHRIDALAEDIKDGSVLGDIDWVDRLSIYALMQFYLGANTLQLRDSFMLNVGNLVEVMHQAHEMLGIGENDELV